MKYRSQWLSNISTMLLHIIVFCLIGTFNVHCLSETKSQTICPTGWLAFEDHCYLYVRDAKTFNEAETYCMSLSNPMRSGHLASVENRQEQNFMLNYVNSVKGVDFGLASLINNLRVFLLGLMEHRHCLPSGVEESQTTMKGTKIVLYSIWMEHGMIQNVIVKKNSCAKWMVSGDIVRLHNKSLHPHLLFCQHSGWKVQLFSHWYTVLLSPIILRAKSNNSYPKPQPLWMGCQRDATEPKMRWVHNIRE